MWRGGTLPVCCPHSQGCRVRSLAPIQAAPTWEGSHMIHAATMGSKPCSGLGTQPARPPGQRWPSALEAPAPPHCLQQEQRGALAGLVPQCEAPEEEGWGEGQGARHLQLFGAAFASPSPSDRLKCQAGPSMSSWSMREGAGKGNSSTVKFPSHPWLKPPHPTLHSPTSPPVCIIPLPALLRPQPHIPPIDCPSLCPQPPRPQSASPPTPFCCGERPPAMPTLLSKNSEGGEIPPLLAMETLFPPCGSAETHDSQASGAGGGCPRLGGGAGSACRGAIFS